MKVAVALLALLTLGATGPSSLPPVSIEATWRDACSPPQSPCLAVFAKWRINRSGATPVSSRLRIAEQSDGPVAWIMDRVIDKGEDRWLSAPRRPMPLLHDLRSPEQWLRNDVFSLDQPLRIQIEATYLDPVTHAPIVMVASTELPAHDAPSTMPWHRHWFGLVAILFLVAIAGLVALLLIIPSWIAGRCVLRLLRGDAPLLELLHELLILSDLRSFAAVYLFALLTKLAIGSQVPAALGLLLSETDTQRLNLLAGKMGKMIITEWPYERKAQLASIEAELASQEASAASQALPEIHHDEAAAQP